MPDMDLRKMLSTVEFTEARRGADRNEVASFLRELARGVAALERQLAETTARAEKAELRLREVGSEDEIRRTLVLAQRTADPQNRLASFISTPELFALSACYGRITSWAHAEHLL